MTTRCIMVQGTGSSVGKSRLVTGLCRVFKQDGFRVAPFKSQNMALNSFITKDGLEIGRAQASQAEACGIEPSVLMNPVLLKPSSDRNSQVVIKGKTFGSLSAMDYHEYKPKLLTMIKECYEELAEDKDIIVIEGAGSPAEINLRERDIVNMGMAELVDAPVVLVGDIDRGGVFASLAGTMLLLTDDEKARVKGVIINKFRGDLEILKPGLKMLEDIIKLPVLGVVPYTDIYIDEEDSPQTERKRLLQKYSDKKDLNGQDQLNIRVLTLPRITNFTDFVPLGEFPGIELSYVSGAESIGDADMILVPGSENPKESIEYIRSRGWDVEIKQLSQRGTVVFGIGSSFSLLAKTFSTAEAQEKAEGLGLLNIHIKLEQSKPVRVSGKVSGNLPDSVEVLSNLDIEGYQIYSGDIIRHDKAYNFIKTSDAVNGLVSSNGRVFGTYIHGIFDEPEFTIKFINFLRNVKSGANAVSDDVDMVFDFKKYKEIEYNRWADIVRQSLNLESIYDILKI